MEIINRGLQHRVPVITAGFLSNFYSVLDQEMLTIDTDNKANESCFRMKHSGLSQEKWCPADIVGDSSRLYNFDSNLTEVMDANGGQL